VKILGRINKKKGRKQMFKKLGKKLLKFIYSYGVSSELKKFVKDFFVSRETLKKAKAAILELMTADDIELTIGNINEDKDSILAPVTLKKLNNRVTIEFNDNVIQYDIETKKFNWTKISISNAQ